MATFEDLKLANQVERVLENLRRDMRANAQAYLDAVTAGKPIAAIATVAGQNTVRYHSLLDLLQAVNADTTRKAKVTSGLAALSLLYADVVSYYTELRNAANAETTAQAATLNTALKIQTMANATLATVAAWDSIWSGG